MTEKLTFDSVEISKLSYEDAVNKIEALLASLEQNDIALESSIKQFELGTKLLKHCEGILSQTEQKIVGLSEKKPLESNQELEEDIPF